MTWCICSRQVLLYAPRVPPTRLVIEFTGHDKDYPSNKGQIGGGS